MAADFRAIFFAESSWSFPVLTFQRFIIVRLISDLFYVQIVLHKGYFPVSSANEFLGDFVGRAVVSAQLFRVYPVTFLLILFYQYFLLNFTSIPKIFFIVIAQVCCLELNTVMNHFPSFSPGYCRYFSTIACFLLPKCLYPAV